MKGEGKKCWVVQKRRQFSLNFYSLPMMFGSNLKRREVIRGLVDAFGGCWAGIGRLDKEIGCRKI